MKNANKQCPNCNSFKTTNQKHAFTGSIAMTILSIPWCFIGIGFLFLIPSFILIFVYYPKRKLTKCKECNNEFKTLEQ